jgi:hypothetical protein
MLSVVLLSGSSAERTRAAVEALLPQCQDVGAQLLVIASGLSGEVQGMLRGSTGAARWVLAPAGSSMTDMRVLAVSECTGDIVAFVDDAQPIPADWIEALMVDTDLRVPQPVTAAAGDDVVDTASFK